MLPKSGSVKIRDHTPLGGFDRQLTAFAVLEQTIGVSSP